MEIIKKLSKRRAWVRIDDTLAQLMEFPKDMTDQKMIQKGQEVKNKRDRLKAVREEIKQLTR